MEDGGRMGAANNLGTALQESSDYEGALPLFEECMAVHRRVRGGEHRNTLASIGNLADLHRVMGRHEQALELQIECREAKRRTLPISHTHLVMS